MKRFFWIFMVLMLTPGLFAIPYSAMGNINTPDAYCLPHLMMEISYVNFFTNGAVVDGKDYDEYDFAANFRIGLYNRVEIGLVYASTAEFYGNLKIKILSETETLPAVSCGMLNIITKVGDSGDNQIDSQDYPDELSYIRLSPFGVLSKSIIIVTGIPALEFIETTSHIGIGSRRFLGRGQYTHYFAGVFFGMDIKPSKYWGVNGEIDGQGLNLGINFNINNFTAQVAAYQVESIAKGDGSYIAVNLQYTVDKYSAKKAAEKRSKLLPSRYMNSNTVPGSGDSYKDGSNPLLEELEQIRERRKQAEKELEEIKKLLQE
jgi:hypothetical protein